MKEIGLLGVHLEHPRKPAGSYAQLVVSLDYLKERPLASIVLTEDDLLKVAEDCLKALRVLRQVAK